MYTTILIIVIMVSTGITTIQTKFQTPELCQKAKVDIERQVDYSRRVISSGCYEQGRVQ